MAKIDKARFWTGVLYPENMRPDWEEVIGDVLQNPYVYCKHTLDKDAKSEHRKDHVHLIVAFPNTTTYKHALKVMDLLSAEGKQAINTCQAVVGIRSMYDYLIHDTDTCRKQGKELYPPENRITGNNFDIGAYEQVGIAEKNEMFIELSMVIRDHNFYNYADFFNYVIDNFDDMAYVEVLKSYSGHFERLTKGNYQRWEQKQKALAGLPMPELNKCVAENTKCVAENTKCVAESVASNTKTTRQQHENNTQQHENNTQQHENYCPNCGSVEIKKSGKTLVNRQRWACKACGKTFVE
jgi:predicted RNA-binding Zn-ribbon protein involved in translation (DUF1610 family)